MNDFSQNKIHLDIAFGILLILFACFKIPYLNIPYFGDELAVHAQAIIYQSHHTISLLPASIDPEYSRGHPLLWYAANALIMRFSKNPLILTHFFNLLLALGLLVAVFSIIRKFYGSKAGFVAALLLSIQPIFVAQSGMMLPEIAVTLFSFLSLYAYRNKDYALYAISGIVAVLTKEVAVLVPLACIVYSLVLWYLEGREKPLLKPMPVLLTLAPWVAFGSFLVLQKVQLGWFIFPVHSDHFFLNPFTLTRKGYGFFYVTFLAQQRYLLSLGVFGAFVYLVINSRFKQFILRSKFILLLWIFFIIHLAFLMNSDCLMHRYAIPLVMVLCITGAISITALSDNFKWIMILSVILWVYAGVNNMFAYTFSKVSEVVPAVFFLDTDMTYVARSEIIKKAVHFIEEGAKPGEGIVGNFPAGFAYTCPEAGFAPANTKLKWGRNKDGTLPDYYLQNNFPAFDGPPPMPADPDYIDTSMYLLQLLKEFKLRENVVRISKVKKKQLGGSASQYVNF